MRQQCCSVQPRRVNAARGRSYAAPFVEAARPLAGDGFEEAVRQVRTYAPRTQPLHTLLVLSTIAIVVSAARSFRLHGAKTT